MEKTSISVNSTNISIGPFTEPIIIPLKNSQQHTMSNTQKDDYVYDDELDAMDIDEEEQVDQEPDIKYDVVYDDDPKAREFEKLQQQRIDRIRNERKKRLQEIRAMQEKQLSEMKDKEQDVKDRFSFLLQQTEVFSQSSTIDLMAKAKKQQKVGGSSRRRATSEKELDDELLQEIEEEEEMILSARVYESPPFIEGTKLRDYQIAGLNWMIRLYDSGMNGILADEMGLGKTLQTISFLGYLKHIRRIRGPHIIIVPKSVIPNWMNEFEKWCPSIKVLKFHGNKEERKLLKENELKPGKFEVCITSYEIAIMEKTALKKFRWKYLIIDEAHRIKNEKSVLSKCVRLFDCQFRLLLTGTPLQNNLHELWALLNFLLPEVFDSAEDFDSWFNLKEGKAETEVMDKLHKVLKPFLLRRLKTDVERAIPPKKEIYVECGMTKMQKEWYRSILTKDVMAIKGREKLRLLNIVMQLRKCCNHPYLFDGAEPGPPYTTDMHLINNSGKMIMLDKLLSRLQQNGSRVLIFTQMTKMLDILEDYCYFRGYDYCRLDGQTSAEDRERQMEEFNAPDSTKFIFLLSTRAGGLGINLATADTVILYDSDWNPQADLQAQDRCHRIGQTKPVNVYRLITKGSIEEKIYERAVKKLYLDAIVIQQGRLVEQNKTLSRSELLAMIKFGAEEIFRSDDATVTDEALDSILSRGEQKAAEFDKKLKESYQTNLLNFSLIEDSNLYEFEGLDYSVKPTTSIALDELGEGVTEETLREEIGEYNKSCEEIIFSTQKASAILHFKNKNVTKKALDLLNSKGYKVRYCKKNDYILQQIEMAAMGTDTIDGRRRLRHGQIISTIPRQPSGPRQPKYYDFQFLNEKRLLELWEKEKNYEAAKKERAKKQAKAQPNQVESPLPEDLTEEEKAERQQLLSEGFPEWTRKDFQQFIKGNEKYGRENIKAIASEMEGKTEEEVARYSEVFWKRYKELAEWEKIIKRIQKGESTIKKIKMNNDLLKWKTQKYKNPWAEMTFSYGQNKGHYTEDEDRYLVCCSALYGYGGWEAIREEIRRAWEFRFDWFIKSRTTQEIARRIDVLIRLIEKEWLEENETDEEKKRKRALSQPKKSKKKRKTE